MTDIKQEAAQVVGAVGAAVSTDVSAVEAAALTKFATIKALIAKYGPYVAGALVGGVVGHLI